MKNREPNADKELYRQLRLRSWEELWTSEVPRFNGASAVERLERVALIRAVGVVFSESGSIGQGHEVRMWLRSLLADPAEKIRRYATNALPKVGSGSEEEADMLVLLRSTQSEREKKFLAGALEKIGGAETLVAVRGMLPQTEQKAMAAVARSESPGEVRLDRMLEDFDGVRIHLRGRRGLEGVMRAEVEAQGRFRVLDVSAGLVSVEPNGPFRLADVYALRCFGTAGFFLGSARADSLAGVMASPLAQKILNAFTEGAVRYRLDFVSKGHQRGAVRELANRVYALCPGILNDPRSALWSMDICPAAHGEAVELRPRWSPDPRFAYRLKDVPAASHPPLAACMARLGGRAEVVWDPFCGSGVELIECALLGGVRRLIGTDRSPDAIAIARANFDAAGVKSGEADFICSDFREHGEITGLGPGTVDLIITNPPLGMRVPIRNLRELISDLLAAAAAVLRPGGRLVFVNPVHMENPHPLLTLQSRQTVDMSGFDCRMEVYVKSARG